LNKPHTRIYLPFSLLPCWLLHALYAEKQAQNLTAAAVAIVTRVRHHPSHQIQSPIPKAAPLNDEIRPSAQRHKTHRDRQCQVMTDESAITRDLKDHLIPCCGLPFTCRLPLISSRLAVPSPGTIIQPQAPEPFCLLFPVFTAPPPSLPYQPARASSPLR